MMKRIKFIPAIILCLVIVSLVIAAFIMHRHKKVPFHFTRPIGILHINKNEKLRSNINTFMESQVSNYDLGKDNYYCSNILYGYDDKYAYAWVYCSGFIVHNDNEIEQGTGFSIPTRLAYVLPNFQVVSFQQPMDDGLPPTLNQLFPLYDLAIQQLTEALNPFGQGNKTIQTSSILDHPSNAELQKLEEEVKKQVKNHKI
jgi:hypothetical protein